MYMMYGCRVMIILTFRWEFIPHCILCLHKRRNYYYFYVLIIFRNILNVRTPLQKSIINKIKNFYWNPRLWTYITVSGWNMLAPENMKLLRGDTLLLGFDLDSRALPLVRFSNIVCCVWGLNFQVQVSNWTRLPRQATVSIVASPTVAHGHAALQITAQLYCFR